MNFSDPRFWLDVAVIIFSAANMVVTWLRKPGEEAIQRVDTLQEHVDKQDKGILEAVSDLSKHVDARHHECHSEMAVLRERMSHMPSDEEMAELAGSVRSLANSQQTMSRQLDRIENYLLNNK